MPFPAFTTYALAAVYFCAIVVLFIEPARSYVRAIFYEWPNVLFALPVLQFITYVWYCSQTGGLRHQAYDVLNYLLVPVLLIRWSKREKEYQDAGMRWQDLAAIAFLLIPFDQHWVDRRDKASGIYVHSLDWALIALAASITGLVLWRVFRDNRGMKTDFRFLPTDPLWVLAGFSGLFVVGVPLGLSLNFLHLEPDVAVRATLVEQISASLKHVFTFGYLQYFAKNFVAVALGEELVFRGLLLAYLDRKFGQTWKTLLFVSVIFGLAHLHKGGGNWGLMQLNWKYCLMATVAGIGYAVVFRKTSSLLYPMALHSLVDTTWHTLLDAKVVQ
jgi:membrane protease YdiL (CAAX protease family)